jgi:hypothetical protein
MGGAYRAEDFEVMQPGLGHRGRQRRRQIEKLCFGFHPAPQRVDLAVHLDGAVIFGLGQGSFWDGIGQQPAIDTRLYPRVPGVGIDLHQCGDQRIGTYAGDAVGEMFGSIVGGGGQIVDRRAPAGKSRGLVCALRLMDDGDCGLKRRIVARACLDQRQRCG